MRSEVGPKPSWVAGAAVLVAFLLAGCDGESSDERASGDDTRARVGAHDGPVQPRMCRESRLLDTGEIRGRATDATLWALPFEPIPFSAGHEVKIVWRMTGAGAVRFTVTGPAGEDPNALQWGPEAHPGSNWNRPGQEWGTVWRFAEPGCWRITVRRDQGIGSVWVHVA